MSRKIGKIGKCVNKWNRKCGKSGSKCGEGGKRWKSGKRWKKNNM